jgi:superfamily II DNA or RNA helicase
MTYQLRLYQSELLDRIYSHWQSNQRRVMVQLPTGGGKTILFGAVAKDFSHHSKRVLILAHREELVKQAAEKVEAIAGVPVGIIKAGYPFLPFLGVQVASVQTLANRLDKSGEFDLVIVDEAHHSTAGTYRKVFETFPDAYLLGVTATPIRLNGSGFRDLFDELVCGITVKELIDQGHLSKFKLFADPHPMTTKGARRKSGDFRAGDVAKLNDPIELSGNLINSYRRHADGKSCVVFAVNVTHSQTIADRYNQQGIPAIHLDSNTPSQMRADAIERFKCGELKVISNCALFDEGLDIPALEVVQIAKPTGSLSRWLQMVGRSLRTCEGKEHAIIIDHTKNWAIHGLPTQPRVWTLDGVEIPDQGSSETQSKITIDGEIVEQVPMEVIEIPDVELEEIFLTEDELYMAEYDRLIKIQQSHQYNLGWLWYRLQELKPPLEVWRRFAELRGHKPGWAYYQHRQHTLGIEDDKTA